MATLSGYIAKRMAPRAYESLFVVLCRLSVVFCCVEFHLIDIIVTNCLQDPFSSEGVMPV